LILEAFFQAVDGDQGTSFSAKHEVGIQELLNGLFCAGSVMISFGAVLGKVSPLQMLLLVIVEPVFFWLNIFVCDFKLHAIDIGGGFYIHMFGAYLGVIATIFLTNKQ
jgi:ammonium transporter Rh